MKKPSFLSPLFMLLCATLVLAQTPAAPPELTPSPSPTPTPADAKPAKPPAATPSPVPTATPTPKPEPTLGSIIDSLSPAELQEAVNTLRSSYIDPNALNEDAVNRAMLQGLINRLGPGAKLLADKSASEPPAIPFLAEILDERIGYLRLGTLTKNVLQEMDVALQTFAPKKLKAIILDLRMTPTSSDFELAAEVIKRFCPKGKPLFTLRKPSAKQERIFTSNQDPAYQGFTVLLVDKDTAGAGEVIAAVLRLYTKAMVIGQASAGQAVEYADKALPSGKILRFAVAEVLLPHGAAIFPEGVKPDLAVEMPRETKLQIIKRSTDKGVSQFVFETERAHMNEAALVAGVNPELDARLAAQRSKGAEPPRQLRDTVLQRALDLVTTITLFDKPPTKSE